MSVMSGSPQTSQSPTDPKEQSAERAHRACEKCTRTKKKCDKQLPACSRCARLSTQCCYDFVYTAPTTSVVEPAALVGYLVNGAGSSEFSGKYSIFEPALDVSAEMVMALLSSRKVEWRESTELFLRTINSGMDVIHEASFRKKIEGIEPNGIPDRPEIALLTVCMQLMTEYSDLGVRLSMTGSSIVKLPTYVVAKRLLGVLRDAMESNVELTQCALLLAMFEFGHGLASRAYTTMSVVASMVALMQIRPGKYTESAKNQAASAEQEEKRALYWSAFIVDRLLHVEDKLTVLPLLITSPQEHDLLPTSPSDPTRHPANVSPEVPLGSFQRLCQCAVLYTRALNWEGDAADNGQGPNAEQFFQLESATRGLIEAMLYQGRRWGEYYDCFATCTSLLFQLYTRLLRDVDPSSINHSTNNVEILKAIAGINSTVRIIADTTTDMNEQLAHRPDLLAPCSPITPYSAFHCLRALSAFQSVIEHAETTFHNVYNSLHFFAKRWGVATQLVTRIENLLVENDQPRKVKESVDVFSVGPFR